MADAGVLKLYNLIEWSKQMVALRDEGKLRSGSDETFADRVFQHQMNRLINETAHSYEHTLFKEALKTGFFEYQVSVVFHFSAKYSSFRSSGTTTANFAAEKLVCTLISCCAS